MATTTTVLGAQEFIADHNTKIVDQGHVIDWANVPIGYINAATGKKEIPAGKAMKRTTGGTYANSDTSDMMIPIAAAADTEIIGLLTGPATESRASDALTGYGIVRGGTVFENLLPDATAGPPKQLAAALKTSLMAAGSGFTWLIYYDGRAA